MNNWFIKALFPILVITAFAHAEYTTLDVAVAVVKPAEYIQYHNRVIVFDPLHQGYERIKPNAFYTGIDAFWVPALNKSHHSMVLDTELRAGYNFFYNGRDHLTPFIGLGFVRDFVKHDRHTYHRSGVAYGALGFLYDHEFNSVLNLGFNGKLLVGGPIKGRHSYWGAPVAGLDFALPITFRFGHNRHWDYRVEPYALYLYGSHHSQDYWGFRNSLAYRF